MSFTAIKKEDPQESEIKSKAPIVGTLASFNFTVNKSADALGIDRRTVKKRLLAAKLKPVSRTQNGYDEYFLGDVARACFSGETKEAGYKVEKLMPKERAEHFMSVKREREVQILDGELIPYDEAAEKFAELGQTFTKFFDTFIDDLEQTQLFSAEQLEQMQNLCDDERCVFARAEF